MERYGGQYSIEMELGHLVPPIDIIDGSEIHIEVIEIEPRVTYKHPRMQATTIHHKIQQ